MRHVFSNEQCFHVFCAQTQDWGRGNSVSFEGDTFKSYQTPVARIVADAQGHKVLLVAAQKHSVTTSGHLSRLRRAWYGNGQAFEVLSIGAAGGRSWERWRSDIATPDHASNVSYLQDMHEKNRLRILRMRSEPFGTIRDALAYTWDVLDDYVKAFALDVTLPDLSAQAADIVEKRAAREARRNTPAAIRARERATERRAEKEREKAAERAERDRLARLADADKVAAWRDGNPSVWLPWHCQKTDTGSAMLRRKPSDGDTVQTSQGAEVPATHARRILDLARGIRETGMVYCTEERIGAFRVTRIDDKGIVAGCHFIDWAEIEAFASRVGW